MYETAEWNGDEVEMDLPSDERGSCQRKSPSSKQQYPAKGIFILDVSESDTDLLVFLGEQMRGCQCLCCAWRKGE